MEELPYPEKAADAEWPVHGLIRRRWSPRLFDERTVERSKILTLLEQEWRCQRNSWQNPEGPAPFRTRI